MQILASNEALICKSLSTNGTETKHESVNQNNDSLILISPTSAVKKDLAVKMYRNMVTLQIMDHIFDEAQKQGRLSLYMATVGEEVINIASAAALTTDDIVLPQGDFHAALNFAAVLEAPVIFLCRNNGWAVSTPVNEQFRSDGIAIKGQVYGVRSIRVDGTDALAVYSAIRAARKMAIKEQRPIIVEAIAYRVSDHASSHDATQYRSREESEYWRRRCSVSRFRKWIQKNGWWSDEEELEFRGNTKEQVLQALEKAEETEKPPLTDLFTDVYD
uniref:2-oxoisovalerate dehydrogenase n=1 Tax=Solanum tuberosum TaxID=4113 RepID=M1A1V6_SOLTU